MFYESSVQFYKRHYIISVRRLRARRATSGKWMEWQKQIQIHIHMCMYVFNQGQYSVAWKLVNKHKKKQVKRRQTERMQNFAATTKRIVIKL